MAAIFKRERFAAAAQWMGLTSLIERWRRPGVLILNYHRVAQPDGCEYDHGVIDSTPEQFERQLRWIRSRFPVLTLSETVEIVENRRRPDGCGVLITFDDGYLDNYAVAFPILRSLGLQGTFFLPTFYVGSNKLLWWDRIASAIRTTGRSEIRLRYPGEAAIAVGDDREPAIRRVLSIYKSAEMTDPARFFQELSLACGCECPEAADAPVFLSWPQAAEMARGGMAFGSHTHTHELLAKMSAEAQYRELALSKETLENKLGTPIETLAYPVGSRAAFSDTTREALRRAGYRVAFSYYNGFNDEGKVDPYDVRRTSVERTVPFALFRFRTAFLAASGRLF